MRMFVTQPNYERTLKKEVEDVILSLKNIPSYSGKFNGL